MTRYKCTVAYIGAGYQGWQSQRRGTSIQEQIEAALLRITGVRTKIIAAGRTDAGVNARGQVFHFDTGLQMRERKWQGAINGFLPEDIHIMQVEEKDERFHARYCVRAKQYDYRIHFGEYDVFEKDRAFQCPYPLDVELMEKVSRELIGRHDFASFCSNTYRETPDQVRTLDDIVFHQDGNILTISYSGRGFLRYMVRMMSAQLLDIGRGKTPPESIHEMLVHPSKDVTRHNAHPEGLTLMHVDYFEILALNSQGMIREYLTDDKLPPGWTLARLEKAAAENASPCLYAFTTRSSQQPLGRLILEQERSVLQIYDEESRGIVGSLLPQLTAVLSTEKGRCAPVEVLCAPFEQAL